MQGQIMKAVGMDFCVLPLSFKSHGKRKPLGSFKQDSDMICLLSICEVSTETFREIGSKSRERECVGGHLFSLV